MISCLQIFTFNIVLASICVYIHHNSVAKKDQHSLSHQQKLTSELKLLHIANVSTIGIDDLLFHRVWDF